MIPALSIAFPVSAIVCVGIDPTVVSRRTRSASNANGAMRSTGPATPPPSILASSQAVQHSIRRGLPLQRLGSDSRHRHRAHGAIRCGEARRPRRIKTRAPVADRQHYRTRRRAKETAIRTFLTNLHIDSAHRGVEGGTASVPASANRIRAKAPAQSETRAQAVRDLRRDRPADYSYSMRVSFALELGSEAIRLRLATAPSWLASAVGTSTPRATAVGLRSGSSAKWRSGGAAGCDFFVAVCCCDRGRAGSWESRGRSGAG